MSLAHFFLVKVGRIFLGITDFDRQLAAVGASTAVETSATGAGERADALNHTEDQEVVGPLVARHVLGRGGVAWGVPRTEMTQEGAEVSVRVCIDGLVPGVG